MKNQNLPYQNLNSILLRMKYDLNKTLSENKKCLGEQWVDEYPIDSNYDTKYSEKRTEKEYKERFEKTYPNFCGAKGMYSGYALPVSSVLLEKTKTDVCRYPRPQYNVEQSTKVGGIWLPSLAEITFTSVQSISETADSIWNGHPELQKNYSKQQLVSNLSKIIPIKTVLSFKIISDGPEPYTGWLEYDKLTPTSQPQWIFRGYRQNSKEFGVRSYNEPDIKDTRNQRQKFTDALGFWTQLLIFLAGSLAADYFAPGTGMALRTEIFLSLSIGGLLAYREWEKGEHVGAVITAVLSFIPFLKKNPKFTGLPMSEVQKFAEDVALGNVRTIDDLILYYNGLDPLRQQLFGKLFLDDDVAKLAFKETAEQLSKETGPVFDALFVAAKQNKDKLYDLKWWQRIWPKEFVAFGTAWAALEAIAEIHGYREKFDDKDKKAIEEIYARIPENYQRDFIITVANSPKIKDKIVEEFNRMEGVASDYKKWSENIIDKTSQNKIDQPTEKTLKLDPVFDIGIKVEGTPKNVEKYKKLGFLSLDEIRQQDKIPSHEYLYIGNKIYYKPLE